MDRMGVAFAPASKKLQLDCLPPMKKKLKPTNVMNEKGEFQYPPEGWEDDVEFEKARAIRKAAAAERHKPGVVSLRVRKNID